VSTALQPRTVPSGSASVGYLLSTRATRKLPETRQAIAIKAYRLSFALVQIVSFDNQPLLSFAVIIK
jgi:hypothetical protein